MHLRATASVASGVAKAQTGHMAEMFSFVGISAALLLIAACWLEARGKRDSDRAANPERAEGPRAGSAGRLL